MANRRHARSLPLVSLTMFRNQVGDDRPTPSYHLRGLVIRVPGRRDTYWLFSTACTTFKRSVSDKVSGKVMVAVPVDNSTTISFPGNDPEPTAGPESSQAFLLGARR